MKKKQRTNIALLIGSFLIITYSCKKETETPPVIKLPVITTMAVSNVLENAASCGGHISDAGGGAITARGVCWSTEQTPTLADNVVSSSIVTDFFTCAITGLTVNTKYYVRAYVTNKGGTSYGKILSFTTQPPVTDIDGNLYHTTTIGTQVWMAENLKVTKYRNGDPLFSGQWSDNLLSGAYCIYKTEYGNLYNWYAVNDSRNIAPAGWHVPTEEEWTTLINYLGGDTIAVNKLKSTTMWYYDSNSENNYLENNSSGFWALPSSSYFPSNYFYSGGFGEVWYCRWWSSTTSSATNAWACGLGYDFSASKIFSGGNSKTNGNSIRCLRDN